MVERIAKASKVPVIQQIEIREEDKTGWTSSRQSLPDHVPGSACMLSLQGVFVGFLIFLQISTSPNLGKLREAHGYDEGACCRGHVRQSGTNLTKPINN